MILIDVEPLYKKFCELEEQARKGLMYYSDHYSANESDFFKWSIILTERTAYKYDLQDAPKIDAEPVVRCGDCKYFQCNVPPDGYLPIGADEYDCRYWGKLCDPDDFCSRGERRDSNDTDTD